MKTLKMTFVAAMIVGLGVFLFVGGCDRDPQGTTDAHDHAHDHHDAHHHADTDEQLEQTTCPVMGIAINKNISTEYQGKTVYFCCPPCVSAFEADPQQYLDKLPQFN